jgi:signal transduction histidine kinase
VDESGVQSSLLGWIIALAISVSVLLRRDKDRRQKLFVVFGGNVTLHYFFNFLYTWRGEPWFERISLALAVVIPLCGLYFFRAFSAPTRGKARLGRLAIVLGVVLVAIVLHPTLMRPAVGPAVLAYVVGFMLVAFLDLNVQARTAATRFEAARLRYLFGGGLATLTLQVAERLGHVVDLDVPPVGLAMTLLYLYVISQTIVRYRVLDLYEMLGRLAVLILMGAALAGIYTALVLWAGRGFAINAFLASLVILLLFDPLRELVERKIADFFFGERRVFEQRIVELRRRLAHVISIDMMGDVLLAGLEESRRITHAALYLIDPHGRGFDLRASIDPGPELGRVEAAAARRYLRPFASRGAIAASDLRARRARLSQEGSRDTGELISAAIDLLDGMEADVVLQVEGESELLGLLAVRDERLTDPYSPEEVTLLAGLASQLAITVENSQLYQQMKERDRLAVLGQMSAGLAHEIRNPLGAIKAAAQFIEEVAPGASPVRASGSEGEFLSVIVEEVDRLNRVVSDFLAYARPASGQPTELEVNDILRRTLQVFETGRADRIDLVVELADDLPGVTIDGERLHQVFLNLIINAVQAMDDQSGGRLEISSRLRTVRRSRRHAEASEPRRYVEVRFSDNGPGIAPEILQNIFIPFFTTKSKGSGIGLAVCQRILRDAGGEIEVRSRIGQGTIFTVVLPASEPERAPVRGMDSRPPGAAS